MPVLESHIRLAAERASVCLALVEAGEPVWANHAFKSLAEASRIDLATLAHRALAATTTLELPNGCFRIVRHQGSEPALLELFPIPGPHSGQADADDQDELTGVLRRNALEAKISDWFQRETADPFALVFLDLDRFKGVNDRFGHLVGDRCLREVGERLQNAVRAGDLVGRFGGDEFVLLLAGVASATELEPIARRLAESIERPIEGPEGPLCLGLSRGAAYSTDRHASVEAMLAAADRAMYDQKRLSEPASDIADPARLG